MTLKKIHRIYFGFDGKPDPYIGYLRNWEKKLPDYQIISWNASNLPIDNCSFSREMYRLKDHAFLSDYFRWWVIREFGGIYFDADIEVVNADILNGIVEDLGSSQSYSAAIGVDNREGGWYTGHSVISKAGSDYSKFMCDAYESLGPISIWRRKIFYFMSPQMSALYFAYNGHNEDGMGTSPNLDLPTIICEVRILPQEYFSPLTPMVIDGKAGFQLNSYTPNTAICHHFSCSWHGSDSPYREARNHSNVDCVMIEDLLSAEKVAPKSGKSVGLLRRLAHAQRDFSRALRGRK